MILVVYNSKGGSGKTALATNLAASWARGQRTLAIDLDDQGDLSRALGVADTGEALADALNGRYGLDRAIRRGEGGVDVAPAGEALGYIKDGMGPDSVARMLRSLRGVRYDAIVIDCPPHMDKRAIAAWNASPEARILVPVEGPQSLHAVGRFRQAWTERGEDQRRLRVVLTRYDGRRVLDRSITSRTRELHGDVLLNSRVRESVVVAESYAWGQPLTIYAPTHQVTEDFRAVAREVADG